MRKFITLALAICALSMSAQKYIDSNNVLWGLRGEYQSAKADNNGISATFDSLTVNIRPLYTGLIELTIDNDCKSPVSVIWDESTLDGEAIVLGDMMRIQIGSSIKPSIVEAGSYLLKEMTTESLARYKKPYIDVKLAKQSIKDIGYMGYLMTLYLCVEKSGVKNRYKFELMGNYVSKKLKDEMKDKANEEQNFTEIEAIIEKTMKDADN